MITGETCALLMEFRVKTHSVWVALSQSPFNTGVKLGKSADTRPLTLENPAFYKRSVSPNTVKGPGGRVGPSLHLNRPVNVCGCVVPINNPSKKEEKKKRKRLLLGKDRNQSLLTAFRRESGIASCLGVKISSANTEQQEQSKGAFKQNERGKSKAHVLYGTGRWGVRPSRAHPSPTGWRHE